MKKIYILLLPWSWCFILLVSAGFAFQTEKTLTLPAEGLKALRIDCGAGRLEVAGADGLDDDRGPGRDQRAEDRATPRWTRSSRTTSSSSLEKRGDRAVLVAGIEGRWGIFFDDSPWIDLTVRVPKSLALEIDDSSGEMIVEDVAGDVVIDDSSGDIRVARLGGRLDIDDSSGDIDIREVAGDIAIDDGSGDIDILKAGGTVKVDDGSGDIIIDGVGGDVLIEDSGSGDVRIDNVKGRVIRHDIDDDDEDDEDNDHDEDNDRHADNDQPQALAALL